MIEAKLMRPVYVLEEAAIRVQNKSLLPNGELFFKNR